MIFSPFGWQGKAPRPGRGQVTLDPSGVLSAGSAWEHQRTCPEGTLSGRGWAACLSGWGVPRSVFGERGVLAFRP